MSVLRDSIGRHNVDARHGPEIACDFLEIRVGCPYADEMLQMSTRPKVDTDAVLKAAAERWLVWGQEVDLVEETVFTSEKDDDVAEWGAAVAGAIRLASLSTIECALVADPDWSAVQGLVAKARAHEVKLIILASLKQLGDAHTELHGSEVTLQGWWCDGDGHIRFDGPETA